MENLPIYIVLFFGLTTLIGVLLFYRATNFSKSFLLVLSGWMGLQTVLALQGFYTVASTMPPRFVLLVLPSIIFIIILFSRKDGRIFIDALDIKVLTLFSVIRIPVEVVLYLLCIHKAVPELITFEGRNFDLISGISAPVLYYVCFVRKAASGKILLIWNFICLGLLLNVVLYALLSIPGVTQQFAYDQPNVAVTYFPFMFLPSVLVPLVLFSHLASIRQLLLSQPFRSTTIDVYR